MILVYSKIVLTTHIYIYIVWTIFVKDYGTFYFQNLILLFSLAFLQVSLCQCPLNRKVALSSASKRFRSYLLIIFRIIFVGIVCFCLVWFAYKLLKMFCMIMLMLNAILFMFAFQFLILLTLSVLIFMLFVIIFRISVDVNLSMLIICIVAICFNYGTGSALKPFQAYQLIIFSRDFQKMCWHCLFFL